MWVDMGTTTVNVDARSDRSRLFRAILLAATIYVFVTVVDTLVFGTARPFNGAAVFGIILVAARLIEFIRSRLKRDATP
jgi:hypothetical protein